MSRLSSHVLDTALGQPARGVAVRLDVRDGQDGHAWRHLASAVTNDDGRVADLLGGAPLELGVYRVTFDTEAYFRASGRPVFYPWVEVVFSVSAVQHHHVPLLLSPFGYTTYRGS